MKRLVSLLCKQTIELPQLAIAVATTDINKMNALRVLTTEWSRNIDQLETMCDLHLCDIIGVADDVITAVRLGNQPMISIAVSIVLHVPQSSPR